MRTVQVVLEPELLREVDLAAKKHHINRSALIRDALRNHLKRICILDLEERAIRALLLHKETKEESDWIEAASLWQND